MLVEEAPNSRDGLTGDSSEPAVPDAATAAGGEEEHASGTGRAEVAIGMDGSGSSERTACTVEERASDNGIS